MRSDVGVILRIAAATWLAMMPLAAGAEELLDMHVVEARIVFPMGADAPQLLVHFDEISALRFANWARRHVGQVVDVLVDGRVVNRPKILTPMSGQWLGVLGYTSAEIEALIPRLLDGRSSLAFRSDERI